MTGYICHCNIAYKLLGRGDNMDNVKQAKEKTIEVDLFIRDTGPLTDEEFDDMMAHDNDDISIEELNFEIFNT